MPWYIDVKNEKNKLKGAKRTAVTGIMGAVMLAVAFFERALTSALLLPPGIKPGLSNIVILFVCFTFGLPTAAVLALIKSAFVMLLNGVTAGFMSLCGGLFSVLTMGLCKRFFKSKVSFIGISVLCAVMHNLGQLLASALTLGSFLYLSYTPVLLISGVVFGSITGIILNCVMPALRQRFIADG